MESNSATTITVEATIQASVETVWKLWTLPEHITKWCNASEDWHAPYAENDLRVGGSFLTRMAAKDGSISFDFIGEYTTVDMHEKIAYNIADGRKVSIAFTAIGNETIVSETFDPEGENPLEMQRGGWQAILDNFKAYCNAYSGANE